MSQYHGCLRSGAHRHIKIAYRYRNSHCKDKNILSLSWKYHTWKERLYMYIDTLRRQAINRQVIDILGLAFLGLPPLCPFQYPMTLIVRFWRLQLVITGFMMTYRFGIDMRLKSRAAETPVKLHSDCKTLMTNISPFRLSETWSPDFFYNVETAHCLMPWIYVYNYIFYGQ